MSLRFINKNSFINLLYNKKTINNLWAIETIYSFLLHTIRFKTTSMGNSDLRFLGIRFYKKTIKNHHNIYKVFGLTLYKKDLLIPLLDNILEKIDKKHDDIYIIRHNIGETYLYLSYINDWLKLNGSKNPLVIIWNKNYISFYRMFLPKFVHTKYINVSQIDIQTIIDEEFILYKGKRIFCPTPNIVDSIGKLYKENKRINFYDYICKDFGLNDKSIMAKPKINHFKQEGVYKRIKKYFKRPFIIIAPFANSLSNLSYGFWKKLVIALEKEGYDIFINSYAGKENDTYLKQINSLSKLSFKTDIEEIFILANKSAGFIGLASGLAVFLTASGCRMDLIYTNYKIFKENFDSTWIKNIYSVHNLPGTSDRIKEYDMKSYTEESLLKNILKKYKKNNAINREEKCFQ